MRKIDKRAEAARLEKLEEAAAKRRDTADDKVEILEEELERVVELGFTKSIRETREALKLAKARARTAEQASYKAEQATEKAKKSLCSTCEGTGKYSVYTEDGSMSDYGKTHTYFCGCKYGRALLAAETKRNNKEAREEAAELRRRADALEKRCGIRHSRPD